MLPRRTSHYQAELDVTKAFLTKAFQLLPRRTSHYQEEPVVTKENQSLPRRTSCYQREPVIIKGNQSLPRRTVDVLTAVLNQLTYEDLSLTSSMVSTVVSIIVLNISFIHLLWTWNCSFLACLFRRKN